MEESLYCVQEAVAGAEPMGDPIAATEPEPTEEGAVGLLLQPTTARAAPNNRTATACLSIQPHVKCLVMSSILDLDV